MRSCTSTKKDFIWDTPIPFQKNFTTFWRFLKNFWRALPRELLQLNWIKMLNKATLINFFNTSDQLGVRRLSTSKRFESRGFGVGSQIRWLIEIKKYYNSSNFRSLSSHKNLVTLDYTRFKEAYWIFFMFDGLKLNWWPMCIKVFCCH